MFIDDDIRKKFKNKFFSAKDVVGFGSRNKFKLTIYIRDEKAKLYIPNYFKDVPVEFILTDTD